MSGIIRQAITDAAQPLQDNFVYYINKNLCGVFNTLLFDHTTVRSRWLRDALGPAPLAGDGAGGNSANREDAALRTFTGGGGGRGTGAGRGPLPLDCVRAHV